VELEILGWTDPSQDHPAVEVRLRETGHRDLA
jgi:hypothetical protein